MTILTSDPQPIHVLPVNDLHEHFSDGTPCLCMPTTEPVYEGKRFCGNLIVHNSWDGREIWEEADEV